jgi:hypothetical protein
VTKEYQKVKQPISNFIITREQQQQYQLISELIGMTKEW